MIILIVITGGVQKGPKNASAFAFITLNSWKTTKKCIFKKINDGAGAPPPFESATKAKASFFGKLILAGNIYSQYNVCALTV